MSRLIAGTMDQAGLGTRQKSTAGTSASDTSNALVVLVGSTYKVTTPCSCRGRGRSQRGWLCAQAGGVCECEDVTGKCRE